MASGKTVQQGAAPGEPGVRVGRSPIAGLGLFATRDFVTGTLIGRFEGRMTKRQSAHVLTLDDGTMMIITNVFKRLNHARPANLEITDTLGLVAITDIRAGDELTIDYGSEW